MTASYALARVYGKKIEDSRPVGAGMKIGGSRMLLSFKRAGGLAAEGGALQRVQVAGVGGNYLDAKATPPEHGGGRK